jgi:hypothetical protein
MREHGILAFAYRGKQVSRFEVYTYTCDKHELGTFIREVDVEEWAELRLVSRPHFTNCWVKGCQMPLTQVRLVKEGAVGVVSEEEPRLNLGVTSNTASAHARSSTHQGPEPTP